MSMRLEMLQIARLSPRLLSDGADLVRDFVLGQINPDGGFKDRAGESDLYYAVFGLNCLLALQAEMPVDRIAGWLESFGDGASLDFVHRCALARCWASIRPEGMESDLADRLCGYIEENRTPDGGYHVADDAAAGNAYGIFLALGAYQDLNREMPETQKLASVFASLETKDGGYANDPGMTAGMTPAVAAAESVLRFLGKSISGKTEAWLLERAYEGGGFFAAPFAPMPDLLSTATALHALSGNKTDFSHLKEPCLDYIDTLWVNDGAFFGNWGDDILDCEYTFYGLLALGHLSL